MGAGVEVKGHADAAKVLEAYRAERDGVHRRHLQVTWLLLSGEPRKEVARPAIISLPSARIVTNGSVSTPSIGRPRNESSGIRIRGDVDWSLSVSR
ncbi:hypothetical protein ROR02_02490 [Pararhodospirillum oryzae]|uniref:Uncharacterized protein n=1 Tax=Pararhodospirillum oryzae TaxID=478448 RepID=A0A512H3Y9_9PROT|nr:hypothetical protein ROR02_02490 [Pararhodospirillum oryzae]